MRSIFVLYVCMKYKFMYVIRIGLPNYSLANLKSLLSLSSYTTPKRPKILYINIYNISACTTLFTSSREKI